MSKKNNKGVRPEIVLDLTDESKPFEQALKEALDKQKVIENISWYKVLIAKAKHYIKTVRSIIIK